MIHNNRTIELSQNASLNSIEINKKRFLIRRLSSDIKGINSSVFYLIDEQNEFSKRVIKFCNYSIEENSIRFQRFAREIDALIDAKANKCKHVIDIYEDFVGQKKIGKYNYKFYVMESAEMSLSDYLKNNTLDISEKFKMCVELVESMKELSNIGIYHRDLKPDNILIIKNNWKICDLGLIDRAAEDFSNLDKKGEKIGPFGWMSPEAMNKFFCEEDENLSKTFDCTIDNESDIFQIGKIFWYIFQQNLPEGQIISDDFILDNKITGFFDIIVGMLQHNKSRRLKLEELENRINPIRKELVT